MAGSQQGWRVSKGGGGSVQSVTGLDTDNTDPANPIVQISVDGTTITGDGTPLSPLQANYLPPTSYGLYAQTSLGAIVTGITQQSLIGSGVGALSVPPNAFNVGDSFLAKMCGYLSCANNEKIRIRVTSNGTVIADAGLFELKIATNKYFELTLDFTITKIGGIGVGELFVNGQFSYNQNSNTSLDGVNFALIDSTLFDTTILNVLNITAQWESANINNKIQSQNFVLNKIF